MVHCFAVQHDLFGQGAEQALRIGVPGAFHVATIRIGTAMQAANASVTAISDSVRSTR
jgi:hypothetical protein